MSNEDWRVEVNLDDEKHGYDLGERLRSQDLDEDARARLGDRVYVSRNGPRLFLYAGSEPQAREAEAVVRDLAAADKLTADFVGVTRWHPVEQAWKDLSVPLPRTDGELEAELRRREEAERAEAREEGSYAWMVRINFPSASSADEIDEALRAEGHPVHRLWRFVTVDALTEERANTIAESLKQRLPEDAEIWVEANRADLPNPTFVFIESRLRDPF
jgi:hypothetical protein